MVKQEKDFLAKKKKSHLCKGLMWTGIILAIYITGWVVTKERANYFTVVAAVLVLPLSINLTRYIAYRKYKDPSPKQALCLEHMKGSYHLYHSAVMPETTGTLFFEHVIVTARNIYFVTSNEEMLQRARAIMPLRLTNKGLSKDQLHFISGKELQTIKNATIRIQKDACFSNEQLGNNTRIIESIIM